MARGGAEDAEIGGGSVLEAEQLLPVVYPAGKCCPSLLNQGLAWPAAAAPGGCVGIHIRSTRPIPPRAKPQIVSRSLSAERPSNNRRMLLPAAAPKEPAVCGRGALGWGLFAVTL